jgi:hypothetical protein
MTKSFFIHSAIVAGLTAISSSFAPAQAGTFSFGLNPFTGDQARIQMTLDDSIAGAGKVQFKIDVDQSVSLGDLQGLFFNIQDESLLDGLIISGADVTNVTKQANSVLDLGNGINLNGGGRKGSSGPSPFDVGVRLGSPGIGENDIRSTVFTISHSTKLLTKLLSLSQFANQSFGVRLTSVGTSNREGSSKLLGMAPTLPPIPAPAPTSTPAPAPLPVLPPPVSHQVVPAPEPPAPEKVPEPSLGIALLITSIGGWAWGQHRKEKQPT